jgi:hypothetical protein
MVLGQDESIETKIDGIGAIIWEWVGPHAAQAFGCVGHAYFFLGPPLLHILLFEVLCHGKLAPAKFQVIWTPFGSLKVKNIEKEVFLVFPG